MIWYRLKTYIKRRRYRDATQRSDPIDSQYTIKSQRFESHHKHVHLRHYIAARNLQLNATDAAALLLLTVDSYDADTPPLPHSTMHSCTMHREHPESTRTVRTAPSTNMRVTGSDAPTESWGSRLAQTASPLFLFPDKMMTKRYDRPRCTEST